MKPFNFQEWLEHWGEERLAERIAGSQKCYRGMWECRNDEDSLFPFPAWELCLGSYWEENLDEWHERWRNCGGKLYEGRMIASKWDGIWTSLSSTFEDGFGEPYPPYAKSSCANWREIGQDEAIVMGVITELEFETRMAVFPKEPLLDRDGKPIPRELLEQAKKELEEQIYKNGGPRPGASRAERVANHRQRERESAQRMRVADEKRREDHENQNAIFRLLEEVENSLREAPVAGDEKHWAWLCESLNKLTTTTYFDRYPNWKARTWLVSAELHRIANAPLIELESLKYALQFNPKLAVKRRIKALEEKISCETPATEKI